jgi:cysteine desulfurase
MSVRSYLDHNATSPLRPEAREALIDAFDRAGNPSSIHAEGRGARAIIENARETVAQIFQVMPQAVTFTSGGTEAANWLLQHRDGLKLALSAVDHPCVLKGHRFADGDVHAIPVSPEGIVELGAPEEALSLAAIVAVQATNNETGVTQSLSDVASLTKAKGRFVVCDAVQAVGRVPLRDLSEADALFFSAHKFGGPKGAGAVVWRSAEPMPAPLIRGGGQESSCSSGKVERSHVLAAMRVSLSEGAIRVSTGWNSEEADIERFLAALAKICRGREARRAA